MNAAWKIGALGGVLTLGLVGASFGAGDNTVPPPAVPVPAAPAGVSPFVSQDGNPPQLPGLGGVGGPPQLPPLGGVGAPPPAFPSSQFQPQVLDLSTSEPTSVNINAPPPLNSLVATADAGTSGTVAASQGPVETYEFLYRSDPDLGALREKYNNVEAKTVKNQEINRFIGKYQGQQPQQQQQPGQPGQPQGQDPRAGAEWDFYYEQLELYNQYVRQRVLSGVEDLPVPTYDAQNYLQERNDLKAAYDKSAISLVNTQHEENLEFYDRLQAREDRRRKFYEWLAQEQRDLDDWAKIWSRKINGARWETAGQPVRRDDWYYGTNFQQPDSFNIRVDGQQYLVSKQPERKVPADTLNVVTTNLTPYDIIDRNGQMKNPVMEHLRGTAVEPAAEATSGTLELVP